MRGLLFSLVLLFWQDYGLSQNVTREVYLMGTSCKLTVFSSDRTKSLDHLEHFIRVLEDTERELSTWQEGSILTKLNHQPVEKPFKAKPGICNLLYRLQHWVSETGGAFDPGIGTLISAWGIRYGGKLPSDPEIKEAQNRSGMRHYSIDFPDCRVTRTADVIIDCGAFGKGEALDRLRFIDSMDEASWLVDLGGQVAVKGIPPGADGWDVSIAHPGFRDKPALNVRLTSGSLATSGGSERDLRVSGRKVSHILDPRSGHPVDFSGSVSVWYESALIADILSTALYVMGPRDGLAWAEARGFAACYLIDAQSSIKVKATRAFREHFMSNHNR
jgi:thiamine biosynthesis lipoprotein